MVAKTQRMITMGAGLLLAALTGCGGGGEGGGGSQGSSSSSVSGWGWSFESSTQGSLAYGRAAYTSTRSGLTLHSYWKVTPAGQRLDEQRSSTASVGSRLDLYGALAQGYIGQKVSFCAEVLDGSVVVQAEQCGGTLSIPDGAKSPRVAQLPIVTGDAVVGSTLQGSYQFSDPQSFVEQGSLAVWRDDKGEQLSAWQKTSAAQPPYLQLSAAHLGRRLQLCIMPRNNAGVWGAETCSEPTGAVRATY